VTFKTIVNKCLAVCLLGFFVTGCLTEPTVKMPEKLPDIVKTYKHVSIVGGRAGLKDTGVRIEEGDIFTALVTGSIDFCPKGSCLKRKEAPARRFVARVGKPETSIYFQPLTRFANPNHFIRTQYNGSGNLYVGYRVGSLKSDGSPQRPDWYQQHMGSYSVDIIVWRTEDWVKIADFLENQVKASPQSTALKDAFTEAAQFRKIELAKAETSRALEKTKEQLAAVTLQRDQEKVSGPTQHQIQKSELSIEPASRKKIAELEGQLQKLTLMLAGLDDMKKQLSAERQKSEKLAAELDEYEAREKDLRNRLEDGTRSRPVIVVASPKS